MLNKLKSGLKDLETKTSDNRHKTDSVDDGVQKVWNKILDLQMEIKDNNKQIQQLEVED